MLIRNQENLSIDALFNIIYELAKAGDEEALSNLLGDVGPFDDIIVNDYNPVMLLAKNGEYAAVELLTKKFGSSLNFAVQGYAESNNNVDKVNELILEGADPNCAVLGYVNVGNVAQVDRLIEAGADRDLAAVAYVKVGNLEQVNRLLTDGADREFVLYAYAAVGNVEQVNLLITEGASANSAVLGYAFGGYTAQVNLLIAAGASREIAIEGYSEGGHINRKNILCLMAYTDDDKLRKSLVEKLSNEDIFFHDEESSFELATKLNRLITAYQINIDQAQGLLGKKGGILAWLLHGSQLVSGIYMDGKSAGNIPVLHAELYKHIASIVLELNEHDTENVFAAVNKKLCAAVVRDYDPRLFSSNENEHEKLRKDHQAAAEVRLQRRTIFS